MLVRVLSALVALPVLLAVVWLGDPYLTLLGLVATVLALREFYRLAQGAGGQPFTWLGYGLGVILLLGMQRWGPSAVPPLLALGVALGLSGAMLRWREGQSDTGWLWTLGGMLYLPLLLGHFLWLRALPQGLAWVLLALLTTFATDTAAYFVGRAVGRRKLAPRLSPGKTWEGAVGGMLGAVAAAALLPGTLALLPGGAALPIPLPAALVLGVLLGVAAQSGDLAESYLKRSAQIKDAGRLIPGHGGLLDRLDSLVFAGPIVYYYAVWILSTG
ncbi:MAG: phosphatidate cytidylyltransferase [Chloroflexi bacterium]|nr:phosphatidate cytidylyltransferase [Chloroflexota bacterium]